MSDSESNTEEVNDNNEVSEEKNDEKNVVKEIPEKLQKNNKYKGYLCDRCGYKTNKLKSFMSHVTRRVPCYVEKNYDYGVEKVIEQYKKKSKIVLDMLDSIEKGNRVDLNELTKHVNKLEILGRVNPEHEQQDIEDIRKIIKSNKK